MPAGRLSAQRAGNFDTGMKKLIVFDSMARLLRVRRLSTPRGRDYLKHYSALWMLR